MSLLDKLLGRSSNEDNKNDEWDKWPDEIKKPDRLQRRKPIYLLTIDGEKYLCNEYTEDSGVVTMKYYVYDDGVPKLSQHVHHKSFDTLDVEKAGMMNGECMSAVGHDWWFGGWSRDNRVEAEILRTHKYVEFQGQEWEHVDARWD